MAEYQPGTLETRLAVVEAAHMNLHKYLLGNGQEGKIRSMERERQKAIEGLEKDNKETAARIESRLQRIETVLVAPCLSSRVWRAPLGLGRA